MTFGSLFAGIGGFDRGLEMAGMTPLWQVEIDPFCLKVLEKHWPTVRRYTDVREVHGNVAHAENREQQEQQAGHYRRASESSVSIGSVTGAGRRVPHGYSAERSGIGGRVAEAVSNPCPSCLPSVDLICGGFPCQPFSVSGKQRGKEDDRFIWPEMFRIVSELRPTWVIGENVPGLVRLGLDQVLSDLESIGYSCQTFDIPACAVDAPHVRHRIWIVANANREQIGILHNNGSGSKRGNKERGKQFLGYASGGEDVADADIQGSQGWDERGERGGELSPWAGGTSNAGNWLPEPELGRVAHGIPRRVDRLRSLGNAVVPQLVEVIGRAIMEAEK